MLLLDCSHGSQAALTLRSSVNLAPDAGVWKASEAPLLHIFFTKASNIYAVSNMKPCAS